MLDEQNEGKEVRLCMQGFLSHPVFWQLERWQCWENVHQIEGKQKSKVIEQQQSKREESTQTWKTGAGSSSFYLEGVKKKTIWMIIQKWVILQRRIWWWNGRAFLMRKKQSDLSWPLYVPAWRRWKQKWAFWWSAWIPTAEISDHGYHNISDAEQPHADGIFNHHDLQPVC